MVTATSGILATLTREELQGVIGHELGHVADYDVRYSTVTAAMAGGPITVTEVPPAEPVKDNLVAFARAIRGEALYPITGEDLVNNITILEATIKSAASDGAVVTL